MTSPVEPAVRIIARPRKPLRAWLIVAGAIVIAATWGLSRVAGGVRQEPPPASPAEARQRQLLAENVGRPGDPELTTIYDAINVEHFARALPSVAVRWEPRLNEVGQLAGEAFVLQGMFGNIGPRTVILVNPGVQGEPDALKRVLCHEMVHAYFYARGDSTTDHGPAFQAVLKRLADERAFEGLVATDEEIGRLLTWLRAESARLNEAHEREVRTSEELTRERDGIARTVADLDARMRAANAAGRGWPTQEEIDAVNARRDTYNIHAADANRDIEINLAAVDEFNRQVGRYNLMVTYPDGLGAPDRVEPRPIRR